MKAANNKILKKELLINFNDVSICFNNLKELKIKISTQCRNYIKLLHESVVRVNNHMPQNIMADVCFRIANQILKVIEIETDIRFVKYKKSNFEL